MIRLFALLLLLSTEGLPHRPARVYPESCRIDSSTIDRTYEPIGNPRSDVIARPEQTAMIEANDQTLLLRIPKQTVDRSDWQFYLVATGRLCTFSNNSVTWGWTDGKYLYVRFCQWGNRRNGHWKTEIVCDTCWWPNISECNGDTIYVLYRASDDRNSFALGNCRPESTWVEGKL